MTRLALGLSMGLTLSTVHSRNGDAPAFIEWKTSKCPLAFQHSQTIVIRRKLTALDFFQRRDKEEGEIEPVDRIRIDNKSQKPNQINEAGEGDHGQDPLATIRQFSKDGTSRAVSAARASISGVTDIAGAALSKGGSDVQTLTNATLSGLDTLARTGSKGWEITARATNSGLNNLARRGKSDLTTTTEFVASTFGGAAASIFELSETGASRTKLVVNSATSSLADFAQKGGKDASSVISWLDQQTKETMSTANSQSKALVLSFTGRKEYQFGDITKTLMTKVINAGKDINLSDVMLLLKVLLAVGATFGPLAKLLPVTLLLEMLNESIEARIGGKIVEALAEALDERFTAAFNAEELGDFAKRSLTAAVTAFTGRMTYKSGDIERAVSEEKTGDDGDAVQEQKISSSPASIQTSTKAAPQSPIPPPKLLKFEVGSEFEQWDRQFLNMHPDVDLLIEESLHLDSDTSAAEKTDSKKALDVELVSEIEEWDRIFKTIYPEDEY